MDQEMSMTLCCTLIGNVTLRLCLLQQSPHCGTQPGSPLQQAVVLFTGSSGRRRLGDKNCHKSDTDELIRVASAWGTRSPHCCGTPHLPPACAPACLAARPDLLAASMHHPEAKPTQIETNPKQMSELNAHAECPSYAKHAESWAGTYSSPQAHATRAPNPALPHAKSAEK